MKKLEKVEDLVIEILMSNIDARNSDDVLYYAVCARLGSQVLENNFGYVLRNFNQFDVPRYESVSRARRKVQAQRPELRATEPVRKMRKEREVMFGDYATR